MSRTLLRTFVVAAATVAVACVSTGYRGGDPFADPGPRAAPPGSRSVQVSLGGAVAGRL